MRVSQPPPVGALYNLRDPPDLNDLVQALQCRGYALVDLGDCVFLDGLGIPPHNRRLLSTWQQTFLDAFQQTDQAKASGGCYRMDRGISVGYKTDQMRQFFETRLVDEGTELERSVSPDYPSIRDYTATVETLFVLLRGAGRTVLSSLATNLGLDPACLLTLTDLGEPPQDGAATTVATTAGSVLPTVQSAVQPEDQKKERGDSPDDQVNKEKKEKGKEEDNKEGKEEGKENGKEEGKEEGEEGKEGLRGVWGVRVGGVCVSVRMGVGCV